MPTPERKEIEAHEAERKAAKPVTDLRVGETAEPDEAEQSAAVGPVELISVGTELLLGNIVNTNAQALAGMCAELGFDVYWQTTVGDNPERLGSAIRTALGRARMVILTGGLGPTEDDITKDICCREMGVPLHEDPAIRAKIDRFLATSRRKFPDSIYRQALVPEGAVILDNNNGTAPGLIIEKNGGIAVLLPGPPGEMLPMVRDSLVPWLRSRSGSVLESAMIKLCGPGESEVESRLLDLIDRQTNPTIATYAKPREVHVRVTAKAATEEEAKKLLKPVVGEICGRFGTDVFTTREDETLEQVVVKLLNERHILLTTAESCTGGMIAARIVNVAGASDVFHAGFVTYSNKAKRKLLGVEKLTLKKYTAVSAQTAAEMADGALLAGKADIAVSVTGLAGPGGGTPEKPVGLVYIGCSFRGETNVEEYHFSGNRDKIRAMAAQMALNLVRKTLLSHADETEPEV